MYIKTLILLCVVFANLTYSQSSAVYEEMGKLFSSGKVIMLGEDRHGVKSIDSFKVDLCKRIMKDTTVVIFESGIAESFMAHLRNNTNSTKSLYPVWRNKYYEDFLDFIKQRGMNWYGIDIQPNSYQFSGFIDSLSQKMSLKKQNINLDSALVFFSIEKQKLGLSPKKIREFAGHKKEYQDFYSRVLDNLEKISATENLSSEQKILLKQVILSRLMLVDEVVKPLGKALVNFRDSCMYVNFRSLSEHIFSKAPHCLVMSHNYHISRKFDNYSPLGEYIYNSGQKTVSVGIYMDGSSVTSLLPKDKARKSIRKNSNCDFYISLNGAE